MEKILRAVSLALILGAWFTPGVLAYQGGALVNHNHSSTAGQGGLLTSPQIGGTTGLVNYTASGTGATSGQSTFGNNATYGNSQVSTFTANGDLQLANGFKEANISSATEVNCGTAYTLSASSGTWQVLTANSSSCALTFNNMTPGRSITFIMHEDASGSRAITAAQCKWNGGAAPSLTTTAYKKDIFSVFYDGSDYLCTAGPVNF